VEPQSPGNIGMVCRAMGNFGIEELRLVNPCPHLHPEARKFAVGAAPLLGSARIFPNLAAAVADLEISIAATRRQGKLRGRLLSVTEIALPAGELSAEGKMGLVFGREDSGLTTGEVALCTHAAVIPTDPGCGSLNLAQAVLIFLYELSRGGVPVPGSPDQQSPAQGEMEELYGQMEEVLSRIAFLNPARPEGAMHALRRIHQRAALDRRELALLRGVWTQLAWSIRDWRGRKRGSPGGGGESR
jgi:tRNA/rRNA methyltransferase